MQNEVETSKAFVRIDEEGILRLRVKNKVKFNEKEMKALFDVYRDMGLGKRKVQELVFVDDIFMADPQAQKYASQECKTFFSAIAIINGSTGFRILMNFYHTFFNHTLPTKMFSTEKKALDWLREQKK